MIWHNKSSLGKWPGNKDGSKAQHRKQVACLILHYGVDRLTRTVLGDILLQDYPAEDIAVYVIDNGSEEPFVLDKEMERRGVTLLRSDENRYIAGGFNWGIKQLAPENRFEYYWLVTNDVRLPNRQTLDRLVGDLDYYNKCGVIQSSMPSDHSFLRARVGKAVEVPFCEWTAPLVRYAALVEVGYPDERLRLVGMDVDWCATARAQGWSSMVDRSVRMNHLYKGTINERLELMPAYHARMAEMAAVMQEKWGNEWYMNLLPEQAGIWRDFYAQQEKMP
jgi:GT2 family glycosyltransferase